MQNLLYCPDFLMLVTRSMKVRTTIAVLKFCKLCFGLRDSGAEKFNPILNVVLPSKGRFLSDRFSIA